MPNTQTVSSVDLTSILTAIGSIATPILVLILTGVGWTIRNRYEKAKQLEEALRTDRLQVYKDILEPFIILLTKEEGLKQEAGKPEQTKTAIFSAKIVSIEYRQTSFQLALIGSDSVVRAFNNLMQYFYNRDATATTSQTDVKEAMSLLGQFLLEIRRSVGNERTTLQNLEMLEWMLTDIRKFKRGAKY